jgi:type II secretory pathway component PulF
MTPEELAALNDEIAGMARAGLPLDQGLAAMARDMSRGKLRDVTRAIADDLRAGHTLPQALERQGNRVPAYYVGLVSAGVRTGRIAEVLATLTSYTRALRQLRTIVVDALLYPTVVLVFALALIGVMCYWILPQFDQIYKDFGMKLPTLTEFAMAFGRAPEALFLGPILVLVGGFLALYLALNTTASGRTFWARLVYATPVVGTLVRSARLGAFTDLLAILIDYEVPLPEAFQLAGKASSDPVMAGSARNLSEDLGQGIPLGEALRGRGLVPEWVAWMTGLGERRGALGQALHQVAEFYRRKAEMRATLLRRVLPPLLILIAASIFAAFFVFALVLPMLKLLEGLSK